MADEVNEATLASGQTGTGGETASQSRVPLVVFAVTSIAFLAYVLFGTVEARIWRFGRLNFEDRTIRHVWAYLGERLPELPGQPIFVVLFWMSLVVLVLGTVAGLWLFLGTRDDDPALETHAQRSEPPTTHA